MLDIKETERQIRAAKARNLRYKKAIAVGMNLDDIRQWLNETCDSLEDVSYVTQFQPPLPAREETLCTDDIISRLEDETGLKVDLDDEIGGAV